MFERFRHAQRLPLPERIAIHHKLLEIFTKRRDAHGFGEIAAQTFKITRGEGPDWQRICELGLSIDPDNPFYQPGGQPTSPIEAPLPPTSEYNTEPSTESADSLATQLIAPALPVPMDLDLDLDFSLHEKADSQETLADSTPAPEPDLKFTHDAELPLEPTPMAAPASPDLSLLEFDLGSLSLDLELPLNTDEAVPNDPKDALATKLALAQEFRSLGDDEGARVLIEEVIAQASGDMKIKAQNALSSL